MAKFRKGVWIELIGFDNEQPDYGVQSWLERMETLPDLVSILLFSTELLHSHHGLEHDFLLGDLQCSYFGRPFNEERRRQNWTAFQLRGLVAELKKHGIRVMPSFFDMRVSAESAKMLSAQKKEQEWLDLHPEVCGISNEGEIRSCICIWKHLSDGTLYEDFFLNRLLAFLKDYGFTGFHGCDGYGHPRDALCCADFSDDMVNQFSQWLNEAVLELEIPKRAEWILKYRREAWIRFHVQRHTQFWRKTAGALADAGFECWLNTCWTRDPHEALFRYGVDYRQLAACGITGFIAEASAAVLEMEGWNYTEASTVEKCQAMLMRLKAMIPDTEIALLGCIKDGMEQYNALRHCPMLMRSEAYTLSNLFYRQRRCAEAVMECLGDGITAAEWHTVDRIRELAFSGTVDHLSCAHVVWSDAAFDREFSAYANSRPEERFASSHVLLYELIHAGAILPSILPTADIENGMTLVLFNPAFFPADELTALRNKAGFLIEIGLTPEGNSQIRCISCGKIISAAELPETGVEDTAEVSSWMRPLPEKRIPPGTFDSIAELLNQKTSPVLADSKKKDLRMWSFFTAEKTMRLILRNERPTYLDPRIRVRIPVQSVKALTEDPSRPIVLTKQGDETVFSARIPPKGTILLEVSCS